MVLTEPYLFLKKELLDEGMIKISGDSVTEQEAKLRMKRV